MKLPGIAHAIGAACVVFASACSFASDVGNYPPVAPPDSLYPFNQPSVPPRSDAVVPPVPSRTIAREPAPHEKFSGASVDRVTGVVTAPGYMGPRAAKGQ